MKKIAIIGLGYVGLPLAVEFGKMRQVVGFDINKTRVEQLKSGKDVTNECSVDQLQEAKNLEYSSSLHDICDAQIYIVTVPTPVDSVNRPDLRPLEAASKTVGSVLKAGDIVIFESTVYPGATEEVCVPLLELISGLRYNQTFWCGYSPERINPGDKQRDVTNICKVTSGSTAEIATEIDELYSSIVTAGTFKATSIRVAEAAKVIENTQRDLNIALMNEFAMIFDKMGIDTHEVLKAASTKWNFLNFTPGLVGGHCIGVDPYYLTYKAQQLGYEPEIILSGRKVNDNVGRYVVQKLIRKMILSKSMREEPKVLILGLAFKENCPDIRNTRVIDIIHELNQYGIGVDVNDPWVDPDIALNEHDIVLEQQPKLSAYDAIIVAVAHDIFKNQNIKSIRQYGRPGHILFDLKSIYRKHESDLRF